MDLVVQERQVDGIPVVAVAGEIDFATAPRVRDLLIRQVMRSTKVVADLSEVEFLDSTGLGVLVAVVKRARTLGGDLLLVITRDRVRSVFEITGLTRAFALYDDLDAAVLAANGG